MGQKMNMLDRIREMRQWKKRNPAVQASPQLDHDALRRAVETDQSLNGKQRNSILEDLNNPAFVDELRSGSIGAALSMVLSKYMKLKPQSQLLLSIAGFGVGKIIYDYKHDPKRFGQYNKDLRMYEIN